MRITLFVLLLSAGCGGSVRKGEVEFQLDHTSLHSSEATCQNYLDRATARIRSCMLAGLAHVEGIGVPASPANAVPFFALACELGERLGCRNLAIAYDPTRMPPLPRERARKLFSLGCGHNEAVACEALGRHGEPPGPAADAALAKACAMGRTGACTDEQRCRKGDAMACARAAKEATGPKAAELHELACQGGIHSSCHRLAAIRAEAGEIEAAVALYEKACRAGLGGACTDGGELLERERRFEEAAGFYGRACDAKEATGCYDLALLTRDGRGVARDATRAATLAGTACDEKIAPACLVVADLAVERDPTGAVAAVKQACELGDEEGCRLARAAEVKGPRGLREARARLGCEAGDRRACYNLALALERADGDQAEAVKLYEKLCPGVPLACNNLGRLLQRRDETRAMSLFAKACDAGETVGCINHGVMATARGDYPRARADFERACDRGDADGCKRYRVVSVGP